MKPKPLVFNSFDELTEDLPRRILQTIGNGAFVSSIDEPNPESLQVRLGMTLPQLVRDPQTEEGIFKFHRFDDVTRLRFVHKKGKLVSEPLDVDHFFKSLTTHQSTLIAKAENALILAAQDKLTQIQPVGTGLNPIKQLIVGVNEFDSIPVNEAKKQAKYVRFLTNLGYLRIEKSTIYPGPQLEKFSLLSNTHESSYEHYDAIMGEILRVGYTHLVEDLQIQHIVPIVRAGNTYYWSSFNFGNPLEFTADELHSQLRRLYPRYKIPRIGLTTYLVEMDRAGIIDKNGNRYSSRDDVWQAYSDAAQPLVA